jgi:hypothetical protein
VESKPKTEKVKVGPLVRKEFSGVAKVFARWFLLAGAVCQWPNSGFPCCLSRVAKGG